jgi:tetratricopeptide (TPR) repeat protein
MKYLLIAMLILTVPAYAQVPYNNALRNGYTKKASVAEEVGLTNVSITYHRPAVNGREGKVWGKLVHTGFIDQGFGNRNPAPWRAGANENTVIEIDDDVKVEGQLLAKGKYGFFIAYGAEVCTLIFSRRSDSWGSFFYDEKDDVLRVNVKPKPIAENVEHLSFAFTKQTPNSAMIVLSWEKLSIPFTIEVDLMKQQYEALASELKNPRSFTSQALNTAAGWCLQNNYQLEKGLEWATLATGPNFPGDPTSFSAFLTKAGILDKLGKVDEAAVVIKTALPLGAVGQLQQLGRQLLTANKPKTALEVFQFNYNKNPDQFITLAGMARGLSANNEYVKALEFANKALPLAPNDANKQAVLAMIEKLKAGKDIN